MVSVIGIEARLIQAHITSEGERIQVRYSQLFNFERCPKQETLELFVRWLLSEPLSIEAPSHEEETHELPPSVD